MEADLNPLTTNDNRAFGIVVSTNDGRQNHQRYPDELFAKIATCDKPEHYIKYNLQPEDLADHVHRRKTPKDHNTKLLPNEMDQRDAKMEPSRLREHK